MTRPSSILPRPIWRGLLGGAFERRVKPLGIHRWGADPFSRGAYSYALPGKADCRAQLAAAWTTGCFLPARLARKNDFSTAHGSYLTGVTAAEQVIAVRKRRRTA